MSRPAWLKALWDRDFGGPMIRATAATWGASASIVLLGIVRAKVNAVALGTSGMGIIGQANYLSTWVGSIATLGLSTGCIRALAAARARSDQEGERAVAHLAVIVPASIGVVVAVFAAAFSRELATEMLGSASLWWVAVLAMMSVPLNLISGGVATVLQGREQISRHARINATSAALNTVLVVGLVLTMGLAGAALGVLLTSVVGLVVTLYVARDAVGHAIGLPWRLPSRAVSLSIAQLGLASLVLGVTSTTSDVLVRSRIVGMLSVATVGIYQPVFAISNQYLLVFVGAIGVYLFPTLTRLLESGAVGEAEQELDRGLRMMLYLFTPIILAIVVLAPYVVSVLYSRAFLPAVLPLRVQLVGDVLKLCAYAVGAVLLPLGHTKSWIGIGMATVAVSFGLAWILIPVLGLVGVGMAYTASWACNLALTILVLRRSEGRWVRKRSAVIASVAVLSVAGVVAAGALAGDVFGIGIGVVVLGVWVWRSIVAIQSWWAGHAAEGTA